MKEYFSHSAYNRWYRQYNVTLEQIRNQFDFLRQRVETMPFPEHAHALLAEEIDEIDIQFEKIIPRDFIFKPLSTRELIVENFKVVFNYINKILHRSKSFDSLYEQEKTNILKKYKEADIKTRLNNLQRHIDEATLAQMKTFNEYQGQNVAS